MSEEVFPCDIIVNGRKHRVENGGPITYEELVRIAYGPSADVKHIYTCIWENNKRHSGSLLPGQSLTKGPNLIVSIVDTSNA